MAKTLLFFVFLFTAFYSWAQKMTPEEYISKYKNLAISEMCRTGVPASITLAQGLLETQFGNSDLYKQSNNHFGIKCKSDWTGPTVLHDDDAAGECFRVYSTDEASYRDHSDFLKKSPRYASLFNLSATDYKGWAQGLRKAGYATNPKYALTLINYIEKYNLNEYTEIGLTMIGEDSVEVAMNLQRVPDVISNPSIENESSVENPNSSLAASVKSNQPAKTYFVEPSEGLYAVAKKFGVTVPQLREWNQLRSDNLSIGQKLIIY